MADSEYRHALPKGCRLENYRVVDVLGVGGFGITYLAEHVRLGSKVAIKEYLPNEFAVRDGATVFPKSSSDDPNFEWGMERFLDEARILTQFEHPNLVKVQDYFEANGTAYFVMRYEIGRPLSGILAQRKTLTERQLLAILLPTIDGLKVVHAENILHRDIKPANIFISQLNESPVLLDFGSARHFMGQQTKSMTALASPGYSPYEQYYGADAEQGPWTDIYSLAAVCWRAIQGATPVEATRRMSNIARQLPDPLPKLEAGGYSPSLIRAVNAGLEVIDTDRPPDLQSWQRMIEGDVGPASDKPVAAKVAQRQVERPPAESPDPRSVAPKNAKVGAPQTKRKPWKKAVAAAALACAVAAAAGLVLWSSLPTSAPQRLTVSTSPATAQVAIRGSDARYGPQGVDLPPGRYQIEVSADDYQTADRTIEIADRPVHLAINLTRFPQPLTLDVVPPEAQLVVAGHPDFFSGLRLPPGTYEVAVSADGFEPITLTVEHGEQPTRQAVSLEPSLHSFVINTRPEDADVKVMNIVQRYEPGMELPPGVYDIEVSASGHETWRQNVTHGAAATEVEVVLQAVARPRQPRAPVTQITPVVPIAAATPAGDEPASTLDTQAAPEMVAISGGQFRMGDLSGRFPSEGPVHTVRVEDFQVSKYEVTIAQYNRFAAETARDLLPVRYLGWEEHPAQVSWHDAAAYAEWLAETTGRPFRLVSEAEWEYAARAGSESEFSFGSDAGDICAFGNVKDQTWLRQARQAAVVGDEDDLNTVACDDNHAGTAAVGQFAPNPFGLHDMHGNLWEWVQDCYAPRYSPRPTAVAWNPDVCRSGTRVARGGAANSPPSRFRSASRAYFEPDTRGAIGFRVAMGAVDERVANVVRN